MSSLSDGYVPNGNYQVPSSGSLCFYNVTSTVNSTSWSTLMNDSDTSLSPYTQGHIEIDIKTKPGGGCSALSDIGFGPYSNIDDGATNMSQCVAVVFDGNNTGSDYNINGWNSGEKINPIPYE